MFKNNRKNQHKKLRKKVHERDKYVCQIQIHPDCKGDMAENYQRYKDKKMTKKKVGLTIDHIIPISKGGKWEIGNLQTACKPCNCKKDNKVDNRVDEMRVSR